MIKKNKAFTLAEILIVMAIVGIITTIGINTYKKHTDNIYYTYSHLYHSLDQAVYNVINYTNVQNPFLTSIVNEDENRTITDTDATQVLCNGLTTYINTFENNCERPSFNLIDNADFQGVPEPHFISANGMRFWISQRCHLGEDHSYIIVFVDINGLQKAPNSMEYIQGQKNPDVFAFAVLDIGRVCPLGPPEIDEKFMRTRVLFKLVQEQASEANIRYSEPSKPYFVSKAEAWGYYLPANRTGIGENAVAVDTTYMDDNPYTYNDVIRNHLINTHPVWANIIYGGNSENSTIPVNLSTVLTEYEGANGEINLRNYNRDDGQVQCEKEYDDVCDLIIDKYKF